MKQLSIDHVQPRSKGGEDLHDNRVLSCIRCNRAKSDFSPWLDKNGQVPKAPNIPALMLNAEKIRPEWNDFLKNVY
jgi:5-methylcytosine-specific restriction endonuclease McrA